MRIDSQAVNRVQRQQIGEGLESMTRRLHIELGEVTSKVVEALGLDGSSLFLSGMYTGIDLGIELERSRRSEPEDNGNYDDFLASLPEAN